MKNRILCIFVFLATCCGMKAQYEEVGNFSHLSVGLNVGTTGVGLDLGTMIGSYIGLRAGFQTFPLKYTADIDANVTYEAHRYDATINAKAKLGLAACKLLVDYYPLHRSHTMQSFHVTAGFFVGQDKILNVKGVVTDLEGDNLPEGVTPESFDNWGVYIDGTYIEGKGSNFDASIKVNSFKPYIGIGFGNSVPMKHRVGVMGEFGILFHGTPKLVSETDADVTDYSGRISEDSGILDIVESIKIYPQVSLRICGRIF